VRLATVRIIFIFLGLIIIDIIAIIRRSILTVRSALEEFLGLVDNGVLGLGVLVDDVGDLIDPGLGCQLKDERDEKHRGADSEGSAPLAASGKRRSTDDPVEVLHENDLNNHHAEESQQEVEVVAEALNNILVIDADLSGIDQVEDLQEDERVEYVGEKSALGSRLAILLARLLGGLSLEQSLRVLRAVIGSSKANLGVAVPGDTLVNGDHVGAKDEQEQNDKRVVDGNTNNLAPHLLLLEQRGLVARIALHKSRHRRLRTKSNGSDDVHDEVDPQELSGGHGQL